MINLLLMIPAFIAGYVACYFIMTYKVSQDIMTYRINED